MQGLREKSSEEDSSSFSGWFQARKSHYRIKEERATITVWSVPMNQSQIRIRFSLALSPLLDDERSSSLIFYVKVREMTEMGRKGVGKARHYQKDHLQKGDGVGDNIRLGQAGLWKSKLWTDSQQKEMKSSALREWSKGLNARKSKVFVGTFSTETTKLDAF